MFKIKSKILKKLSAGFMAGLCAFSMLGSTMSGVITANAASTSTENSAFPSADTVIAKAATLLGYPYTFGNKGYWYAYNQDQYTPLSVQTINNLGIDCSGLVYYTLTQLGYKTSGFSWNNPVPVDTDHWLTVNDNCTISYGGKTSKVDVEKKNIKTTDRPYWECSNGSTITPGSVVVAQNPYGEDHAWIYMGEFNSRSDVVSYLKSIGVSESLINSKTVGDGKGDGGKHWRIEANGSEGVVINNKTDGKTATAMNMSAFRITKTDVTFEIDKYNTNGDLVGKSSVDNSTAVYGIYSDKSCKNKVAEIKIGSNGKGSVKLPNKTYYAKEIKAHMGYALDKTVYKIKAGVNKVKEDFQTGKIKINKSAEDGIISGRKFKITYSYNGKSLSETAKTNAKGIATFDNLKVYDMSTGKAITYTVSEINVDTRYEAPKAKNVKLTDGDVDLTINVKFNNELKTGSIKINKQSEDNHNGGREFTVTGNGKTYSIKTGSDGVAILSDIPVYDSNNQKIVYTISEKNVPVKYVVPASQTVTLTADATTTKTFKNVLKKFTAQVTKQDSETASAQGDGTLSGAVYGIYRNGELVDTYTTDENGYFKTKEYVCGNYTVQEISPSEGYLLDETMYPVGAETENYSIEHNPISMTVTEDVLKGKISIIKHSDDGSTQIETPEVGAEFEVYLKSSGSYEAANDSEKDYLVCDENGYAQTKMLPYGIYVVHQIKGLENTEQMEDFEVNISENEKEYFYLLNDAVKKSFVKIVKKGAETGNIIPVSGIGFKVWDCANSEYVSQEINYPSEMILNTFYTDESGSLMLPNELVYGDYELHEVQSAEGYVLDKNPVPFTIDGSVETVVVEKTNTAQKGKISVQKTGNVFASVTALGSAIYIDENGEVHESGQTTYTPVFAKGNLSGAVFQVIASEDIITLDGTIRANAGDVVAEITTDENGYAETDLLYLGKYEVRENTAPDGYVLNAESQFVELTYAGQEIAVRDTVNTSFVNDYQGVEISLSKVMEKDELFNIGNSDEYTRVRFGLFAAENITAVDGSVIPADGLISEISLAENMSAKFDTALPFGKYYVQEIATDEHYVLNGKKYLVNFEYMGQEVTTVTVDCGEFKNALKRGKISGKKVDENEKSLENALFGLFAVDTAEFTADNAYMTAVSDENGHFEFDKIPYGEYIVREIEAPTGYILSDESYPVTISEDGEVIEIKAVNKSTKVRISKQDITTGEELPGATLQIIDEDGNVATEWVSTDEAHFIEGKLIAGKEYTLRETIAPDGYEIASEIKFTVNTDGSVTEVVMYDEHTPDLEIPPTVTIDTPNTGVSADNSAELYLVAAAVIMAFGMVICKRNDKEQRKDDVK
ncbi:SpaA isopeptide-forming pilin-related protein [Ruminococcus bicirculans (ex Wegman et al. 2014)]|uniref:SpaA isopeptide-forming pilin-related protein n=1 Tax=Ruminococcus bicirculans (ex Wegman et al. 2014) TaxID=1160721 RepID=A0AAW5KT71_9FIRM|nr:SpaA isopeptide-forming pilin-related protein [Ruminococcus bicirculans (ex Wegman et al. 2014)]MCQ5154266.1 SpaA isopeptide-forming pilin-related protein [Ruminococcus bicirculans (ex Wegman et al. 2014)]